MENPRNRDKQPEDSTLIKWAIRRMKRYGGDNVAVANALRRDEALIRRQFKTGGKILGGAALGTAALITAIKLLTMQATTEAPVDQTAEETRDAIANVAYAPTCDPENPDTEEKTLEEIFGLSVEDASLIQSK